MNASTRRLAARALDWLAIIGLVAYAVYFTTAGAPAGDAHAYWEANPLAASAIPLGQSSAQ